MNAAEDEACLRGCKHASLDTISFQALGFDQNLGYTEFSRIDEFSAKHE